MRWPTRVACLPIVTCALACGGMLPDDVVGYEDRCTRMNDAPIPEKASDSHRGHKNVYACDVPLADLQAGARPYPDGAMIVKESTRDGEDHVWLVATARKQGGKWRWDEYTRNFSDEAFRRLLVSQDKCADCHKKALALDWIYTAYQPQP